MTVAGQKLTAYELQVLIGTTISGCNMSPDRTFDLPAAWARLKGLGLIDRADGLAIATPAGVELVASAIATQHRIEAEAGFREFAKMVDESPHPERSAHLSADARAQAAFAMLDNFKRQARALAASPSSPASGMRVKVKPLVWRMTSGGAYIATAFDVSNILTNEYLVAERVDEKGWNATGLDYETLQLEGTLHAAKAACQADYEARILSALGEHP